VGGHLLDPVALVLRAGSELITNPLPSFLSPSSPRSPGFAKPVPRQMGVPPYRPLTAPVSAWSLLVCLVGFAASPQLKQGTRPRTGGEACALANSGCLTACLTARTAARGASGGQHGRRTADAHRGLPRYRTGQGPLPDGSTAVVGPLYRPNGHRYNRRLRKRTCSAPRKYLSACRTERGIECSWSALAAKNC
jgi:hypothetical protein